MPTLIVSPNDFDSAQVVVNGDEYRHLFRALRLQAGDPIRVVDGVGRARDGLIESVDRQSATVRLGEAQPSREASCRVELAVAQLRPERARWLVEKVTELGVDEIVWFQSQRSQQKWQDRLYGRLERVARSAVEQSGRSRLPRVDRLVSWQELMANISHGRNEGADAATRLPPTVLAHPTAPTPSSSGLEEVWSGSDRCRILIGPEGGFTDDEVAQAVAAGATPVGLGERILRVETAAVALAATVLIRAQGSSLAQPVD